MHRVVKIALGIPGDGEGLRHTLVISRPRPDLVVALLGKLHLRDKALPGKAACAVPARSRPLETSER